MFSWRILCSVLLLSGVAIAQSPDAIKYAPRPMLLLSGDNSVEAVMPILVTADGQQHLEFVPASKISESLEKGGQPIRLGDVLAALGEAVETINRLQAENEKLWKVAMKDSPKPPPPTVVVQPPAPQGPNPLQEYLLLRSLMHPSQPVQLPPPVLPNANRVRINCTTQRIGTMTYTNCY